MNDSSPSLRLTHFSVQGLFGEFNHSIPLCKDEHITALIGPNGMGKTVCLRLINSLFHHTWMTFQTTEFKKIEFQFNDKSVIQIDKPDNVDGETDVSDTMGLRFVTLIPGDKPDTWFPRSRNLSGFRRPLEQYLPFLTRIGPRSYVHDNTRQIMSIQEILANYADRLPESILRAYSEPPSAKLEKIISQIDCHLIETQRLLVFEADEFRKSQGSTLAISHKANVLKEIIANDLAVYASTSQSLDRSFPKRVLQEWKILPSENIRENLAKLDDIRKGLMDAGILDPEVDDALPPLEVTDNAIAAVLSVYIQDSEQKLNVLTKLKQRIQLFINLINSRFFPKKISVDKKKGFSVERQENSNTQLQDNSPPCVFDVPLEKLSSGEQHQLVLFFELLFELKKNALILIDEPELSLHVAWQKQFIPDLLRIIRLNKFNVLLATHSPQLIGEWEDIVVELGKVDLIEGREDHRK
ncbi:excinuclease ATPase subunit [Acetobacter pasteurianus NBRC 3279]|nr:excinuclease ATPase subunit [Acetobacter pasteurianus NBRC 3279]GCD71614.1 excinuclease ATPase subunit [Acetobacter pasteurianus NBRC 3284]